MSADLHSGDGLVERGSIPLDIDNVHMLLQVEQVQIQKRTFTNWVNAQLAKRRPPCMVLDLFNDFRDGSKLLDLLEVMSGQRISRERGRGMFQHRSNIEKALAFLKKKSIKLVNINIPDILDGKPSIILGLIWTIILQYHIEELASCLSFDSRQSSMESLASLDTRSTLSSRSASSSPVPPRASPLHNRFRVSAKKALLLWVREQCHKAGCSINVKDFKASWRSGVVFLAILYALRPDLVDLSKARTRSNKQNLEEAFRLAERELRIPRLLEPDDVDVRDPDEKSIMTYVAQFLQYSRDLPVPEEDLQDLTPPKSPSPITLPVHYTPAISASPLRQATPDRKAQEVTCWLAQAYDELLEGWDSTEGESYSERYHVFQTFLVSFNEQRRPIMPLLTAMRRSTKLSEEQRSLREAWDTLTEKLREYRMELDMSLPAPLDSVARWLLRTEGALTEEEGDPQDHGRAADEAREKQELLKVCLEEMPQHLKTFQSYQNLDEYGNMVVPTDKMDELKRRFTSVRVTAKYHGIKLEYREHRHTVLDVLGQIRVKLHVWRRPYISPEAVRVLLHEWHEVVNKQELPSLLEAALRKLKQISEKYSSKSALAADYHQVSQQVKQLEEDASVVLDEVTRAKGTMGRVLAAWDSYSDCLSSLQAWLEQGSAAHSHRAESSESLAEWGSRQAHLTDVGNFLIESADPQTSRSLAEELRKLNMHWAEFVRRNTFESRSDPGAEVQASFQDVQALIREATLILKEPLEAMAGPLRTYRKRLQFTIRKIKEVDLEALHPSPDCPVEHLQKLKLAVPEVMQTLFEAEQVCAELQHSVSGLDSRLAELLHWETEARELYQLLRATDQKQKQKGQDPRAKVLISRGLQLEGQVVTEEQDLQVMVMTSQKNSPLQYLHASAMQGQVRVAVAQSQEAVGMLSSLGARRDRSRSPPEASPPSKIFIQAKERPQHLRQSSDIRELAHHPEAKPDSHQCQETFLPQIVVQEYRDEKTSPPVPYTYAAAVIQTRRKSPPEGQIQAEAEAMAPEPEQTADLLQQEKPGTKQEQPLKEQQDMTLPTPPQPHELRQEQHQVEKHQGPQPAVSHAQAETQLEQTVKKTPLSTQELQSRKVQAMKSRPWLQKAASGEQKSPAQHPEQDQTVQRQSQSKRVESVQVVPQQRKQQTQKPDQHDQQQQQQKDRAGRPPQPDIKTKSQTVTVKATSQSQTVAQSKPAVEVQVQSTSVSHTTTDSQEPQKTSQTRVSESQSQTQVFSETHGTQSQVQTQAQAQKSVPAGPLLSVQQQGSVHGQTVAQVQTWAQVRPSSPMQPPVQGQMQPPVPSHIQLRSHPQSWAPVRPPSPKPPTPTQPSPHDQPIHMAQTHVHLVTDPQTHDQAGVQIETHPQPKTQIQTYSQSMAQASIQAQSIVQAQTPPQPKVCPQPHAQSMAQTQNIQPMARPSQSLPVTHHQTQAQTSVQLQGSCVTDPRTLYPPQALPTLQQQGHISQGQLQTWTQVQASSPMSVQHPQATGYPQAYSQVQSSPQQWAERHEPQNQASTQQRHPIPYPQQMGQGPHPQAYPPVQVLPQWAQHGPQIPPHVYSQMGSSYAQPQNQPWPQTQPPLRPQSPMQQTPLRPQSPMQQTPLRPQGPMQQTPLRPQGPMHQPVQMRPHGPMQNQPPLRAQIPMQQQVQMRPQGPMQPRHQIQAYSMVQTQQGQAQQPAWVQPQSYQQPQSQYLQVQPQTQTQMPLQFQPPHQAQPHLPSQVQLQSLQAQSQTQVQSQLQPKTPQPPSNIQFQQPTPQPKHQSQLQLQPMIQSPAQLKESPPQFKHLVHMAPQSEGETQPKVQPPTSLPQTLPGSQSPPQTKVLSPNKPDDESPSQLKVQAQPASQPAAQSPTQPKLSSPTQTKALLLSQPKPQAPLPPPPQTQAQSPLLTKTQTTPPTKAQSPPQARPQPVTESKPQPQPSQPPQTVLVSQVSVVPQTQAESPDLCFTPPALAQAPPQAYTEAYAKAQALARNGFEEAKHCLQAHILEAITVFKDKRISAEQGSVKEETLRALDPELLEEFLRAAKGMEAFCTPSQLRDMEFFTQSVRTQWEACFSAEFAKAGQHLEALKDLCDTLSPEDAHRLAQTQLRECEKRLAAIQHQFSGDQDTTTPDSKMTFSFSEDLITQKEPTKPSDKLQEVPVVTVRAVALERREVEKQPSVEEEVTKREALERYENYKRTLQGQLAKNEQSIKDIPSDSVSLKGLHTRLQEIQFLRQETESLWSEYANLCSQCCQLSGSSSLEQEKAELQEQWRSQQSSLQRRGSSLGAALRQIDSTENHMVDFTDRLDRYLRQPKHITVFTLANTNILKDIKDLDDNIQSELDQLSRLDPESSDLDPRDCYPLTREVETHRASLDQLRQQVRKSEAAARALDRFLMSLRTVDEDISGVQGAPCSDAVVLQDCRSKLSSIRQSIDSLKEKAPQLDLLLQGARLTVTRDGVPASCLDMVTALLRRLEEADGELASQQKSLQKETQSKSLGLRKRTLLGELRKLQDTIETQSLKEPTMPAVQHRLRALSDLEGQLQAQQAEVQSIRELQEKQGGGENLLEELEAQWRRTQKSFSDRKKQCSNLLELLKKFQTCRSHLSNTIQRAEHTISDQASYMGKDNLQRSITKVRDIKEELGGLGGQMEEMRTVCRQLQSELKKFPDCSETSFEVEAETLMDSWLDVTEKTDAYMDNLQVGLELWEKQLLLGGEVDSWAGAKLTLFAESHPFHNEQQVLAMRDEIHANEENVDHFHKKSAEIQEMLQTQEAPLELQVMETQLRKRMEQVKELFTDCTDVFEELIAVKKHLAEKIEECQTAVENIQSRLSKVDASGPKVEAEIQDLCDDLGSQEEQAEAVLKEVGLVSSVASPQVLEALSVDCSKLRDAISRTKDMVHLKREERDKGLLKVIGAEKQSFEDWFQDLQLCVNECFENPESRTDVETSVQRLTGFLKSKDAERRLEQLKEQLERGSQQVPPQQLSELHDWLKEQQEEVATFRTHCHYRQKQMEDLLRDLDSLQKQHDSFCEWLQNKEKQSAVSEKVQLLLKDLQDESGRAETLSQLLASVRRQGVRAESLLKDGDNLIQRYRNLEARLQKQAEAQRALEREHNQFNTQAESTRTWISDLLRPLTNADRDAKMEDIKSKALAILRSRPEGDSKVNSLRRQSERLCEQDEPDDSQRQKVQLSVRDTETLWETALQAAEEALSKAETRALLDKDIEAFHAHAESVQSWIRDHDTNLKSLSSHMMQAEGKMQAALSFRPDGEAKLQDLRRQCQSLCDDRGSLDEGTKREIHDAVGHTEEQWRKVVQAAEEAEAEAAADRDVEALKTESEALQRWIKEQRQKLLALGSHVEFETRMQTAQAVIASIPEGQSRLMDLKRRGESVCEHRKPDVQQLLTSTEQQWTAVLQAARQAELRSLSEDFDTQSKSTESWIRERQQRLQAVSNHTPPEERGRTAQAILTSRPEGDCQVNNLRRRGQSLCDHQDSDEARGVQVQQTVRDTEELWRTVLQAARQLEAAAGAEKAQEAERRRTELREFDSHQQDTAHWLKDLRQQLESLCSQTKPEDRVQAAQAIWSSKPEGDSKIQKLRSQGQSLCSQDLEDHKKQEVQERLRDTEEQWTKVLHEAKEASSQAERQCTLDGQLRDFETLRGNTGAWLEEKQETLSRLDSHTDPGLTINMAQTVLSCKPEGDSKLAELRRQSRSLCTQEDLEEDARRAAQKAVTDSEGRWTMILQTAEATLKNAEVQYSLSRELQAFQIHAGSTQSWMDGLQRQADSMGGGTLGSKTQLEDRLTTAQSILSCRSNGETQVSELQRRAQRLCDQQDLDEDRKQELHQMVRDMEQRWRTVLQAAEGTQRQLQVVVDRLVSCQVKRHQAETRLAELQKQTSGLPHVFPWPGLGERRQAVDQARTLLDQSTALAPVLREVHSEAAELFELTQDQTWSDPTWTTKQESIPALLRQLTEAVTDLECGILTERQCMQLVEQHEAAQDWLREQVKGLRPPASERGGLHGAANTLKALLQTVDREQREMKELDSIRDSLLCLCTPGGQDALNLEVSHLHDLCASSEQEVRERLAACERQLEALDSQLERRAQGLKERAAALQWELRSLDQALSYSEPQNNIRQLQQHWTSLQNCEKSLEDLGVKVNDLHQEVKSPSSTDELPPEIIRVVESLQQQHSSLRSRLTDHQGSCSTNTASCLSDCLQALQRWSHSRPSESGSALQGMVEEGETLQADLQEALSHHQFLTACLSSKLFEKLEKECSGTLGAAESHKASLKQSLKELDQKSKQKPSDTTRACVMPPPRKNKRSPEKKSPVKQQRSISLSERSSSVEEDASVSVEDKTQKPAAVNEETRCDAVEQTRTTPTAEQPAATDQPASVSEGTAATPVPSRRKSKKVDATQVSPSGQTEVEETKQIVTYILDVSTTDGAGELTSKPSATQPDSEKEKTTGELQPSSYEAKSLASEQSAVLPPIRKSKSPKLPQKSADQQTAPKPAGQSTITEETNLVPFRRRSKGAETSGQGVSKRRSTDMEPEDNKKEASLTHQVETEPAETTAVRSNGKISPAKRRSKILLPEQTTKEEQDTSLSSEEQTEMKRLEVSSIPEPVAAIAEIPGVELKEPKEEPAIVVEGSPECFEPLRRKSNDENKSLVSEETKLGPSPSTQVEQNKKEKGEVSPTKRKQKGLKPSSEFAAKAVTEIIKEPDSHRSVEETETKLVPARRKSKTGDTSTGPEPASVTEVAKDLVSRGTRKELKNGSTAVVGALTPPTRKLKSRKASPDLSSEYAVTGSRRKSKEGPEGQKSASTPEVVTKPTTVEKGKLSPPKRKSKPSTEPEPESDATQTRRKSKETKTEPQPSGTDMATCDVSPAKQKPKGSPELSNENQILAKHDTEVIPPRRKSKSPELSGTSETLVVPKITTQMEREQTKDSDSESVVIAISSGAMPVLQTTSQQIQDLWSKSQVLVKGVSPGPETSDAQPQEKKVATVILDTSQVFVHIPDTHHYKVDISTPQPEPPQTVIPEPEDSSKKAPEPTIAKPTEQVSATEPPLSASDTTDTLYGLDYISKLWKNTSDTERRYLILDVPDTGLTVAKTPEAEMRSSEEEIRKPSETMSQLSETLQEGTTDDNRPTPYFETENKDRTGVEAQGVKCDFSQPTSAGSAAVQPHETETGAVSTEQDIVKPSETVSHLSAQETLQERLKEVLDNYDIHEDQSKVLTQAEEAREVRILQLDIPSSGNNEFHATQSDFAQPRPRSPKVLLQQETEFIEINLYEQDEFKLNQTETLTGEKTSVTRAKEPRIDIIQTVIQTEAETGKVPADAASKKAAVEMTLIKMQEGNTECEVNLGQSLVSESLPAHETKVIEISLHEEDTESQTDARTEIWESTQDRPGEDQSLEKMSAKTEPKVLVVQLDIPTGIQCERPPEGEDTDDHPEGPAGLEEQESRDTVTQQEKQDKEAEGHSQKDENFSKDVHDALQSLNEKAGTKGETVQAETITDTKEDKTSSYIEDLTSTDVHPEKTAVQITMIKVEEPVQQELVDKQDQVEANPLEPTLERPKEVKNTVDQEVSTSDESKSEIMCVTTKREAEVETQHVEESSTSELSVPAVQREKTEKLKEKRAQEEERDVSVELQVRPHSATLPEVPQTSSAVIDHVHVEAAPPQEHRAEEAAEESAMSSIFTEIQLLAGIGPNSQLIEGKPLEDAPESLITSTTDLDGRLTRLVSKILSYKNRPAEMNPTAMAQQVEEIQECREVAQAQVLLLCQLREADDADNQEALENLEDQWSAAAQDAATVIQSKEAQLQLVTDFCRQIQTSKTTMSTQAEELDAIKMSPQESSSKKVEHLQALQRNMEENRTVLGELLVTHTKLCPHLSRAERATVQTELKNLQETWTSLERTVESSLHHANIHSHKTRSLLSELSGLQEHLETVVKDLKSKSLPSSQWNCKQAQQLMEANAEVKAAQQQHLYLQQLSEVLLLSSQWEMESKELNQGLQSSKDKLDNTEALVSSQTLNCGNPVMENIIVVMRDGLAWAKQTESDIEGRRKQVALLPEEVHRQLRDLKKLQSEVMAKQSQLESLVEEVTDLLPQLDQAEEVPMVHASLERLEDLEASTTEKLSKAVKEIESGLQTREKLSEQIADIDSWILAHLQRDASRSADSEFRSPTELDRRLRQIQETLEEAEKQAAVCEALLMKSKDIASELSVTENCQLFDKLTKIQEDIRAISSYEKANKKDLDELILTVDSSRKTLATVEKSLRQMLVDLSRHRFPITRESLQALEPFKHMILEHKSQVDLLQPWIPQEKTRELNSVISELHSKMVTLEMKARDHERYLNTRQCVEDLREKVQEQVHQTKEESRDLEKRYKVCQTLLVQVPLVKGLCAEAYSKLQAISADLYPSQLSTERQRLKQNEDSLNTWEMTLYNNLSIIEWNLLKQLDLESERKDTQAYLRRTQQELQRVPELEPNEAVIYKEYQRTVSLKKTVESRMRALEVLEQKKGDKQRPGSQDLMDLKKAVLSECDSHMENVSRARESFQSYTCAVREAAQFLRDIEVSLLPPQGSVGLCCERLVQTQQALDSLQQQFQIQVEKLQNHVTLHPYLSPLKVEQLQENILSQLLVRMSTLQAKGHIQLERLSRCAEQHRKFTECHDEFTQSMKTGENRLLQLISQKVTCLADCMDQDTKLRALSEETGALLRRLEELREWCPEQSCCGGRETGVTAIWRRFIRLRRCTQELTARSEERITEWRDVTDSVEKAAVVLEQVEVELPDGCRVKASIEDLQDLLQSWEQYQDRLDCEHRALSALELRAARLLGVPAHLEQAPPTPLCQQLQAMQGRYSSVKQRSREGLLAARLELEDREKLREELQGVRVWLEAAGGVLSEMEQSSSTQELQEVYSQLCTQRALLQRIIESLKMKYSDPQAPAPPEIDAQVQDVTKTLQQVEVKVGEAVQRSGPVHQLGAKMSEIQAGLSSVQGRLEQRSPTVIEAKVTQKRVWDELDRWHSRLAALEVDMQDLEKPEEALPLTERLVEVQQLHSLLAKQAEQRTTLISKIHTWLQEHQEMINSSKSWMSEAQTWLVAPCTYTTAKCLSSHVHALQMVLDDSAQIRSTLQGFGSVLKEMSQVCNITTLQEQLLEADRQVARVQESFTAPLSQLQHAAAEVEAIESEVRRMENDVAEIKNSLSSPETFPSPREDSLKAVDQKIQSMRRTVAEIQKCKPGLCLPEKAEETLTVFTVVDQLQVLLLELEKKVPALFIQQPPTPIQAKAPPTTTQLQTSTSEKEETEEPGHIRIAHVEEDVLKRSGAALLKVERSSPEQRQSETPEKTPQEPAAVASEETGAAAGRSAEQTAVHEQDVEGSTDTTEASSPAALSKPLGTVRTQPQPDSMVNTASTVTTSKADAPGSQQRCVVS